VTKRPISFSGVIRKRLPAIEAQMFEGVRQAVIVEGLAAEGYAMSVKDFRQLLYRARKAQAATKSKVKKTTDSGVKKGQEKPVEPEKNVVQKTTEPSKKMSQDDLQKMLSSDIDLDAL